MSINSGIEVRALRALSVIAEAGTFRAAADELGYTQSAISHQVATLEEAVGRPLLLRPGGRGRVSLTPAGEIVLRRGRRALSQLEAIGADMEGLEGRERPVIRVGVSQTSAAEIMPAALREFHGEHPGTEVVLTEMADDETAIGALVRGRLDLTFAHAVRSDERVAVAPLLDDPLVVLMREEDPATRLKEPGFEILDGADVVAWTRRWSVQVELEEAWAKLGIAPRIVYRTDDNLALQRLVAAGLGRACIGRLVARRAVDSSLTFVLPREQLGERRIFLCTSRLRPTPPRVAALIAAIHDTSRG